MKGFTLQVDYSLCGIVLAGGNLVSTETELFTQLLYADVFRGVHATGVFAKRLEEGIVMAKDAVPSHIFMRSKEYQDVLTGKTTTTVAPAFIVGHNRHATRGASGDPKGAHPFQHGNITLVHNGTLTDQSLLPEHQQFMVDSDNICYSINKIGAAETIQKLDGAFTLIWHDASDDTVHIIRNEERPFHLAKVGVDWFGASEEDMLMWILTRNRSYKNRSIEHFECEVGVEYVFDVSGKVKKFTLKEQIKHTLPVFTYASRFGSLGGGWQNDYGNRTTRTYPTQSQEERKAASAAGYNATAIRHGLEVRVDHRIEFIPTTFVPFSNGNKKQGKLSGCYMDGQYEYVEVDAFTIDAQMYEDSQQDLKIMCTGTVQSIIEVPNKQGAANRVSPRVIVTGVSLVRPDVSKGNKIDQELTELNDDIPFDQEAINSELDSFRTVTGREITRTFWIKHDHGVCLGCNKGIAWVDAPKAAFAYNAFWHPECLAKAEEAEKQVKEQATNTFYCACCGEEKEMKFLDSTASSVREEDVCSACGSEIRRKGLTRDVDYVEASFLTYLDDGSVSGGGTRMFNRREFESMIRERGSDVVQFKDLSDAKITLRSRNLYAYFYKKEDVKTANEKLQEMQQKMLPPAKEEPSQKAGTFPTAKYIKRPDGSDYKVTKAVWVQIGSCINCRTIVPWMDVEKCSVNEYGKVICKDCRGK